MSPTIQQLLQELREQTPSRDLVGPVIKKIRYQKMRPYIAILGVLAMIFIASLYNISRGAVGGELYILRSILQDSGASIANLSDTISLLQMSLPWQKILVSISALVASAVYLCFFILFNKSMMKHIVVKGGEHI